MSRTSRAWAYPKVESDRSSLRMLLRDRVWQTHGARWNKDSTLFVDLDLVRARNIESLKSAHPRIETALLLIFPTSRCHSLGGKSSRHRCCSREVGDEESVLFFAEQNFTKRAGILTLPLSSIAWSKRPLNTPPFLWAPHIPLIPQQSSKAGIF